jgi:hypothetical protein
LIQEGLRLANNRMQINNIKLKGAFVDYKGELVKCNVMELLPEKYTNDIE